MVELRDSKGHFARGNVPHNKKRSITFTCNKRLNSTPKSITFTCKFCGKPKPLEDMRVIMRFFPPLPACRDCWKLHG